MSLTTSSAPYLRHIERWLNTLPVASLSKVASTPARTAVLSVDIINGFCTVGPLASPRVQGIVKPITALFKAAHKRGVRYFLLAQDTHPPDAVEFGAYPPHCVRGTAESGTAPELLKLPFADSFVVFEKTRFHRRSTPGWIAGWTAIRRSTHLSWSAIAPICARISWRCICGCAPTRCRSPMRV